MDQQLVRALALVPGDFIDGVDLLRAIDARLGDVAVLHRRFVRSADGGHWLELAPPAGPTFREWDCGNGITARSSREPLARASADVAAALDALVQSVSCIVQSGEQLRPHVLQHGRSVPVPREQWPFVNPLDESTRYPRANVEAFVRVLERERRGEANAGAVVAASSKPKKRRTKLHAAAVSHAMDGILDGSIQEFPPQTAIEGWCLIQVDGDEDDPNLPGRDRALIWAREAERDADIVIGLKSAWLLESGEYTPLAQVITRLVDARGLPESRARELAGRAWELVTAARAERPLAPRSR